MSENTKKTGFDFRATLRRFGASGIVASAFIALAPASAHATDTNTTKPVVHTTMAQDLEKLGNILGSLFRFKATPENKVVHHNTAKHAKSAVSTVKRAPTIHPATATAARKTAQPEATPAPKAATASAAKPRHIRFVSLDNGDTLAQWHVANGKALVTFASNGDRRIASKKNHPTIVDENDNIRQGEIRIASHIAKIGGTLQNPTFKWDVRITKYNAAAMAQKETAAKTLLTGIQTALAADESGSVLTAAVPQTQAAAPQPAAPVISNSSDAKHKLPMAALKTAIAGNTAATEPKQETTASVAITAPHLAVENKITAIAPDTMPKGMLSIGQLNSLGMGYLIQNGSTAADTTPAADSSTLMPLDVKATLSKIADIVSATMQQTGSSLEQQMQAFVAQNFPSAATEKTPSAAPVAISQNLTTPFSSGNWFRLLAQNTSNNWNDYSRNIAAATWGAPQSTVKPDIDHTDARMHNADIEQITSTVIATPFTQVVTESMMAALDADLQEFVASQKQFNEPAAPKGDMLKAGEIVKKDRGAELTATAPLAYATAAYTTPEFTAVSRDISAVLKPIIAKAIAETAATPTDAQAPALASDTLTVDDIGIKGPTAAKTANLSEHVENVCNIMVANIGKLVNETFSAQIHKDAATECSNVYAAAQTKHMASLPHHMAAARKGGNARQALKQFDPGMKEAGRPAINTILSFAKQDIAPGG